MNVKSMNVKSEMWNQECEIRIVKSQKCGNQECGNQECEIRNVENRIVEM